MPKATNKSEALLRKSAGMISLTRPWFALVTRSSLRSDMIAGLTNAAIVLPQGVAFAIIAGLPPELGLYTAMITSVIAAFWGASLIMVSGPTTAISAVLFASLVPLATPGSASYVALALALTVMVGAIQLAAGFARLGGLISFISHSVIVGFTSAAACLIFASQIGPALGIATERGGEVIDRLGRLLHEWDHIDPTAALIAATSFGTILLCRRVSRHLPAYLLALVTGALAGIMLDAHAVGISMFAPLPSVVPAFQMPSISLDALTSLFPSAVAIGIVGLLEAVSIGRTFATRRQEPYDTNQEIVGQGLSNMIGGFFQAYAGSGSFTRSGLNAESGARTPLAAILASGWLMVMLLVLSPFVVHIPVPAVAGIILFVAWRLIDFDEIHHILHSPAETVILVLTFLCGVLIELEFSIIVGVLASLAVFIFRSAHPFVGIGAPTTIDGHRCFRNSDRLNLPSCPHIGFYRIQGPIFFASVDQLEKNMRDIENRHPTQKTKVLIVKGVGTLDLAGADFLINEVRRARGAGGDFFVVTGFPDFINAIRRYSVLDVLGEDHLHKNKNEAVRETVARVPLEICAACSSRVFFECVERPCTRTKVREFGTNQNDIHQFW